MKEQISEIISSGWSYFRYNLKSSLLSAHIIALGLVVLITAIIAFNSLQILTANFLSSPEEDRYYLQVSDSEAADGELKYYFGFTNGIDWTVSRANKDDLSNKISLPSIEILDDDLFAKYSTIDTNGSKNRIIVSTSILLELESVSTASLSASELYDTIKEVSQKYLGEEIEMSYRSNFTGASLSDEQNTENFTISGIIFNSYLKQVQVPQSSLNIKDIPGGVQEFTLLEFNSKEERDEAGNLSDNDPRNDTGFARTVNYSYSWESDLNFFVFWIRIAAILLAGISAIFIYTTASKILSESDKSGAVYLTLGVNSFVVFLIQYSIVAIITTVGLLLSVLYSYTLTVLLSVFFGDRVLEIFVTRAADFSSDLPILPLVSFPVGNLFMVAAGVVAISFVATALAYMRTLRGNPLDILRR